MSSTQELTGSHVPGAVANLPFELEPTLAAAIAAAGIDAKVLSLNPQAASGASRLVNRNALRLGDGTNTGTWEVPSIRALWRGDVQVATFAGGEPPAKYMPPLKTVENMVHIFAHNYGSPSDAEMVDIYSALRRRPDGRSLGLWHDLLFQAVALILGSWVISASEYEALLNRLERSARTFNSGAGSKNYIGQLHRVFHKH